LDLELPEQSWLAISARRKGFMSRVWKIALLLAAILLFAMTVSLAWSAPQKSDDPKLPVFNANDRQLIEAYYNALIADLAPGSIDRSGFALGVEKALAVGSRVPMQFEKDLKPLPRKLELQLTQLTGDYGRYTLGRHVVLVHKVDLAISGIMKNVAVK
jgi:hypothetical protein